MKILVDKAVIEQALEALESAPVQYDFNSYPMLVMTPDTLQTTLTALREVLAVSEQRTEEQEPVAWALTSENGEVLDCISHTYKVTQPCAVDYDEPLYAAPVRTKDLTDEEEYELAKSSIGKSRHWLVAAAINAYKEKNNSNEDDTE